MDYLENTNMKYKLFFIAIVTLLLMACTDDNPELLERLLFPEKESPKINIKTPTNNSSIAINSIVYVDADVNDADGLVKLVSLALDGQIVKKVNCSSGTYSFKDTITANQMTLGSHILTLTAKDNDGNSTITTSTVLVKNDPVVLVNQMTNMSDWGVRSQDFEVGYNDQFAADDFYIPADENWTISEIAVDGFYQNYSYTSTCNVNVIIFNDNGSGKPGAQAKYYENITAQDYNGDLKIQFSQGISLSPGSYWICVQNKLNYTSSERSWYWRQSKTDYSSAFYWRDGTASWQYGPSVFANDPNAHNLSFSLTGFSGGKNE